MLIFRFLLLFSIATLTACGSKDNNNTAEADQATKEPEITVGEDVQMETAYDFLINANMNSQVQIELSKVAAAKSNTPEVKALGQQIVIENKTIQNNILTLSEAAGIDMAPALSVEYIDLLDSIQSLSGEQFDEAYVATVIEEHQEDIDQFTRLAEKTENTITRGLVTDNLEILRRNLDNAERTQKVLQE